MEPKINLERLAAYIRSHGYETHIHDTCVEFSIPVCKDGKHSHYETACARDYRAARIILGY